MKKRINNHLAILSIAAVICIIATAYLAVKASLIRKISFKKAGELAEMSALCEIIQIRNEIEMIEYSDEATDDKMRQKAGWATERLIYAKTQLQQCRSSDLSEEVETCIDLIQNNESDFREIVEKADEIINKLSNGDLSVNNDEGNRRIEVINRKNDYLRFNVKAEMTEEAVMKLAKRYFSDNSEFTRAEGNSFPTAVTMCGENIYVSLSHTAGELLELMFDRPAGKKELDIGYCKDRAVSFLLSCGIDHSNFTVETKEDELFGVYRIFFLKGEKEIQTAVRWDTGRLCYYNAYNYYR